MKSKIKPLVFFLFIYLLMNGCTSPLIRSFKSKVVYKSSSLIITRVSENSYIHTSFLQTNDFGNVPCNGLLVGKDSSVIVYDTPTEDKASEELINWVNQELHSKIAAIIPTHFHSDCLGGLHVFHKYGIPSYASERTIQLAREQGYEIPRNSFKDELIINVGSEKTITKFLGEGHTKDNVVGYFPAEKVMFGGCLIKELGANKGYLGDANLEEWSNTVKKVRAAYPEVKIVIPGHGKFGNKKLLDYTIDLFKTI